MKEALKLALEEMKIANYNSAAERLEAALAQPAQEPDNGDELTIAYMSGVHRGKELAAQPAQRPWMGLTEAQFLEATRLAENGNYLVAFVRIQEWLKEKNT